MNKKVKKQITNRINSKDKNKEEHQEKNVGVAAANLLLHNMNLPRRVILQIAEEVGKAVSKRLVGRRRNKKTQKKIESPLVLDTSAIIDGRVFQLSEMGVFYGSVIVLESVLSELKNIADSKDDVKKERGRRALKMLDDFKKQRGIRLSVVADEKEGIPVDESIIFHAKKFKGRIVTCDYNLSKKAKIGNVLTINLYEMANVLKTTALPGEQFWVKIVQVGKGVEQGVGYLPDGTMLVVEHGKNLLGKTVQVTVSRIIQTDAGKILFAKIKE